MSSLRNMLILIQMVCLLQEYMMTYSLTSGHEPDPRILFIPGPITYGLSRQGFRPMRSNWRTRVQVFITSVTNELRSHPWDKTLRTLPKSRMTKQGNFTQRTPQAKKQIDQASRQVSKQVSGSTNTPCDLVFPATGPSLGTTQPTATITSTEDLRRAAFTTPPQTALGTNSTEPPPPPIRNKGPELGADNLTLEGVATELAPNDFVSQNYETLVTLMQEETKKRSSQSLQA
ncbi:hypothetical protein Tco_0120418 [Tanacetum coccineum]